MINNLDLLNLLGILGGIGFMALLLRQSNVPLMIGMLGGVVAGLIGVHLFMIPSNYCSLDPEADFMNVRFGLFLSVVGVIVASLPIRWGLERFYSSKRQLEADTVQGAFRGWYLPIIFLAPTVIILALFLYYPALDTFRLATLLTRFGQPRTAFICFDNFTAILNDQPISFPPQFFFLDWIFTPEYASVVLQTMVLSLAIVFFGMGFALMIALAAFLPLKGASIYRTLLIWPYAISPVVAGIIFLLMFNPLGGVINYFLNNSFGITIGWLNDPNAARWAVIIASVWKSMGFNILFFIAGLQNVPKDLIEAASIDGANLWQRFWRIVVPMLSPISFFLLITNITYAFFETFGTIDFLTSGGPVNSTETIMYRVYETGVGDGRLGAAAAQSLFLFVIVIGITVLQFRTTGEKVNYGA
jgi:sn-glycerol 3-phosphate transport system permease protein